MSEPWFRMHANIGKRKVTARLMEHARIDKARAVGYLAMFWGALSQHCPGGIIADVPDPLLEEWAEWKGKRGIFAAFIREKHSRDGRVNDYEEYSGRLEERKERDRQRKAAAKVVRDERGNPADSARNAAGIPPEGRTTSSATIRYDTKRDETEKQHSPAGRREPAPWMGAIQAVWGEVYPNGKPPAGTATALRPLFARRPPDEVVAWFRALLTSTPAQYLNISKSAATYTIPGEASSVVQTRPTARANPADRTSATIAAMVAKSGGAQ